MGEGVLVVYDIFELVDVESGIVEWRVQEGWKVFLMVLVLAEEF